MKMSKRHVSGFTMIEIMVVIAILGILAALVVPQIAGKDDKARVERAKSDIKAISSALEMYKLDNYSYPTTDQGLDALVNAPGDAPNWAEPGYLRSTPKDPWGQEYIYISPGQSGPYDLVSMGSDRQDGGEGYAADISLSDL